jgi:hypothetical protein
MVIEKLITRQGISMTHSGQSVTLSIDQDFLPLFRVPDEEDKSYNDLRHLLDDRSELPTQLDLIASDRGLALGVMFSVPIWGTIGSLAYFLMT